MSGITVPIFRHSDSPGEWNCSRVRRTTNAWYDDGAGHKCQTNRNEIRYTTYMIEWHVGTSIAVGVQWLGYSRRRV
jgi:hypothetical protein